MLSGVVHGCHCQGAAITASQAGCSLHFENEPEWGGREAVSVKEMRKHFDVTAPAQTDVGHFEVFGISSDTWL